jgi:septation ring formation regulator EzrA
MPIAQEDMDFIKAQFETWLMEKLPEHKPGVYDLELRTRMLKVEEELRNQRELMQQGFAMMDKRFESMQHNMDKRFENMQHNMDKRFENMQHNMDKQFEQVDKRFEQMDKRFEQVDKRFEQVDKRFEQVDKRFEQVDKRFESIQQTMDKRFDALTNRIDRFMRWSFALTITVAGIIIAVLKFT